MGGRDLVGGGPDLTRPPRGWAQPRRGTEQAGGAEGVWVESLNLNLFLMNLDLVEFCQPDPKACLVFSLLLLGVTLSCESE